MPTDLGGFATAAEAKVWHCKHGLISGAKMGVFVRVKDEYSSCTMLFHLEMVEMEHFYKYQDTYIYSMVECRYVSCKLQPLPRLN